MIVVVAGEATHVLGLEELDAETLRLLAETLSELGTADSPRKTRDVVEVHRRRCLAAQGSALDDQGIDPLAGAVQSRGQPRRAATDHDQIVEVLLGGGLEPQPGRQLGVRRIGQDHPVTEAQRRDPALAGIGLDHEGFALGVLFDVDPLIGNLVLAQELLAAVAVGAPVGTVEGDPGLRRVGLCFPGR